MANVIFYGILNMRNVYPKNCKNNIEINYKYFLVLQVYHEEGGKKKDPIEMEKRNNPQAHVLFRIT